ncbi:cupin domain-containing protein [Pseudonocardia sp. TRM90224]|uniref:cupin domain-containing protein n=1 Tax=Pseudonocardia sp. TRM90224 TaxID=2812678 RepID=UPI001E43A33B|nr:cupin domain-containing protein [Pseudonocardia sp. TRM90224]
MPIIHSTDARRTETPNGVMTTFASPTQGGTAIAMWRVDGVPASVGPDHTFDADQIWTIVDGALTVDLDGESHALAPGDTIVMPAGVRRQVHAGAERGFAAIVAAPGDAKASAGGSEPVLPGWIA